MSDLDLIGSVVIAVTTDGSVHGAGRVIGYCDEPTFIIENADGVRFSWVTRLCAPAREDCPNCHGRGYALPEPTGDFAHDLIARPCKQCAEGE